MAVDSDNDRKHRTRSGAGRSGRVSGLLRGLRHPVIFHTIVWGTLYIMIACAMHLLDPAGFPLGPLASGGALFGLSILGGIATASRLVEGRWSLARWRFWFVVFCTIPWIVGCAVWAVGAPRYSLFGLLLTQVGVIMGFGVYRVPTLMAFGLLFVVAAFTLNLIWQTHDWALLPLIATGFVFISFFYLIGLQSQYWMEREAERGALLRGSRKDKRTIHTEREKSERLLLNILPADVARELKEHGRTRPQRYESASVLFTDFEGFTQIAAELSPEELIGELDRCFSYFDQVSERYGLEKLKTIGDSFMCAGGIPVTNRTHAVDCVLAALEIQAFMNRMKEIKAEQGLPYWELRLGIHSGPLVAGVIGEKKFAYDVWGDTVNTASRLESGGVAGRVNVSSETHALVRDFFECEYRGRVPAKHKGEVDMYFVNGVLPDLRSRDEDGVPTTEFHTKYRRLAGNPEAGAS